MKSILEEAIKNALTELGLDHVDFVVEHPSDMAHGDYATNVAMVLAKKAGRNPRELAEDIIAALDGKVAAVAQLELAGPGFINVHLTRDFFTEQIVYANKEGAQWGSNDIASETEVVLEYTSPNLFKPLHIGNLVGNIIGESLTRLFENAGATLYRLNYPSDIGPVVAKGVWGLKYRGLNPDNIEDLGRAYVAGNEAYEAGGAQKEEIDAVNRALYAGDDDALNALRARGIATSRARLAEICTELGTHFDFEILESESGPIGSEIVKKHVDDVFEVSDGAVVYRGEQVGLHTRVFINSQGLPTYEAKDLGNFTIKQKKYPNWTHSIIVTGGEQAEYFKVLYASIRALWPEAKAKNLEHIPTGFLTLTTGKMSSRKGNVLTGESLLAELKEAVQERAAASRAEDVEKLASQLAVGALKFQILKQKVGMNIVFDKGRALSFEGDSGPYVQYTHARISSLIQKADAEGITAHYNTVPDTTYAIEKFLYRFNEVTSMALEAREPHHLVTYLLEIASAFNTFYAQEKIADADDAYAPYKLALTQAVGQTIKNGLWMLGIEAPERM
ncbi:MAG: arginine--tRNA ligase [Candidatus Pacebacteria bacterium]|nr:arginine--tRNA ligase [Candidatus Paceibacterota bacterium]